MPETGYWVTVKEAVELTGRSERTIRRWIGTDKIPTDRKGPVTRVDIAGLIPDIPLQQVTYSGDEAALQQEVDRLTAEVARLQAERDRMWELARQAQALALSYAPKQLAPPQPRRTVMEWLGFRRRPDETT